MNARVLGVAAAITFVVALLRLAGELFGWDSSLFGTAAGGGAALVGIGWLVPVFGWVFGRRLAHAGPRPPALAWRRLGAGIATLFLGFTLAKAAIGPTPLGMVVGAVGAVLAGVLAFASWPALGRWLLAYALLARLPIVAITAVAITNDWGTHYEKLADGAAPLAPLPRFCVLVLAQAVFWLPITLLGGALAGVAASRFRRAGPAG